MAMDDRVIDALFAYLGGDRAAPGIQPFGAEDRLRSRGLQSMKPACDAIVNALMAQDCLRIDLVEMGDAATQRAQRLFTNRN